MIRIALLVAAGLLLAGCATRPVVPVTPESWAARAATLATMDDWEAHGRIAIRAANGGGQGSLHWEQRGELARIRLSGPFGAGAYLIEWDRERLTVTSRDGEVALDYAGPSAAEQFLYEQLGWWFPAIAARYWLRGLADPAASAVESFDAAGRLAGLDQHGWQVRYEDWQGDALLPMPRRLVIENEQARVRVVLDRWQL